VKIATFNINGIERRLPNLLAWLRAAAPDVACNPASSMPKWLRCRRSRSGVDHVVSIRQMMTVEVT
jgi:hypothetical protein